MIQGSHKTSVDAKERANSCHYVCIPAACCVCGSKALLEKVGQNWKMILGGWLVVSVSFRVGVGWAVNVLVFPPVHCKD